MFDNNSDYALNKKDKDSIVYKGCDGYEQRISREQFATEEEFLFWKSWSDEDYRETDYKDAYYYRHIVQLNSTGTSPVTVSSPEEMLINQIERTERIRKAKEKVLLLAKYVTTAQFRRMWFHLALGENVRSIAKREGVVHSCIVESITSAKKKIFESDGKKPTKTP